MFKGSLRTSLKQKLVLTASVFKVIFFLFSKPLEGGEGISAGSVSDRSFFLLPLPITIPPTSISLTSLHFQPGGSYNLDLVWENCLRGEGLEEGRGRGTEWERPTAISHLPQNHFFYLLSDLSSLEEESQCESCYGEIPEPPFPVFHLEDHRSISEPWHSQLWTQPTKSRLQT